MGLWPAQEKSSRFRPPLGSTPEGKVLFGEQVHLADIDCVQLVWLNQVFFKLTTLFTKLSICVIYLDVFKRATSRLIRATRVVTICTAMLVVGYYFSAFWATIFQCTPIPKTWYPKAPGSCIDLDEFRHYTAAANIITSVLIIMTPLPALSRMRQARPEISELMGLILLGLAQVPLWVIVMSGGLLTQLSHTACTIARLVLMQYPDPAAKSDPQCKALACRPY